jgi:DNA-binding transcriptional MerR regulator
MPDSVSKRTWTLAELAEETGLPARTIRFYIARGLLESPVVKGRKAWYAASHVERLRTIRELQARGLTLAEIGRALEPEDGREALPEMAAWQGYQVADDVTVMVRAGGSPWRINQVRQALREFAARLKEKGDEDDAAGSG